MSRPRVAIVTPTMDAMGGTEQLAAMEARAIMARADVTFFTDARHAGKGRGPAEIVGVQTPNLPGVFGTEAWFKAASKAIKPRLREFSAVYSPGINCDCATHICVNANFTEWVAMHKGAPLKGSPIELQRRLRFRRLADWEKRLYRRAGLKLATVSHKAAARLQADFGLRHVEVFAAAPEAGRFTPALREARREVARQRLRLAKNDFAVFCLGNAWYSKGFDLLIEAWRGLQLDRPGHLIFVTSERVHHLRHMLPDWPESMRVFGREKNVEDLYAAADLVVLPSRGETFGLPIAEAGAMHVPVLVSEHAGVSGYVPAANVVSPNNAAAWRVAIGDVAAGGFSAADMAATAAMLAQNSADERSVKLARWVLS